MVCDIATPPLTLTNTNYSITMLLGVVFHTGGRITPIKQLKSFSWVNFRHFFSKKRLVLHSQRHFYWVFCTGLNGALQNYDGGFYCAIKGTVKQAVMLGLAATLSHTAENRRLIALGGMS